MVHHPRTVKQLKSDFRKRVESLVLSPSPSPAQRYRMQTCVLGFKPSRLKVIHAKMLWTPVLGLACSADEKAELYAVTCCHSSLGMDWLCIFSIL